MHKNVSEKYVILTWFFSIFTLIQLQLYSGVSVLHKVVMSLKWLLTVRSKKYVRILNHCDSAHTAIAVKLIMAHLMT